MLCFQLSMPVDKNLHGLPKSVISKFDQGFYRIRKYLNNGRAVAQSLSDPSLHKKLFIPSILGEGEAVCLGSFYDHFNFLLFSDIDSNFRFYVVQHNNFCAGFFIPDLNSFFVNKGMLRYLENRCNSDRIESAIDQHLKVCEGRSEGAQINGMLDGYRRPYHYFYDRFPYFLVFQELLNNVPVLTVNNSFFPGCGEEFYHKLASTDSLNEVSHNNNVFFLQISAFKKMPHYHLAQVVIDQARSDLDDHSFLPLLEGRPVFWIGVCEEKRKWPGKIEAIVEFIKSVKTEFDYPVFIFDGMTCPSNSNVHYFRRNSCSKDLRILNEILKSVKGITVVDLIGSKAKKKILFSQVVTFFFANAFTDSMWPAHFGRAKGIGYSATAADFSGHDHPLTFFLPRHLVQDADDEIKIGPRKGFNIDIDVLRIFFAKGLQFVREVTDKVQEGGLFANSAKGVEVHNISVSSNREDRLLTVDVPEGMPEIMPLFGDMVPVKGFQVLSSIYFFKMFFSSKGDVKARPLIIFYSDNGEQVESVYLDKMFLFDYRVHARAARFLVFLSLEGKGTLNYHGFYAQPCIE